MMEIIPQGDDWSARDVVDLLSMIWSGISQSSDICTGLQEMGWRGLQQENITDKQTAGHYPQASAPCQKWPFSQPVPK